MSDNNAGGQDATSVQASSSRRPVVIPASAPAGKLVFTEPLPTVTSYYKIAPSNPITFGWSFTYVLTTAERLTVLATCANGNAYPVGPTDGVIPGTATQVVWDPYEYQLANPNPPLPQAQCNLMIADERGFNVRDRAGFLSPNTGLQFALYSPQAYTALADGWKCTVCSSASSIASHPAAISLLVTIMICFLSGFHLLRTTRGNNP